MEGLFWIVGCLAFVVFAMSIAGRGKRRRPRWTSSTQVDPVVLAADVANVANVANVDNHHHHHHHHHHDGGGHHGGFDGGGHHGGFDGGGHGSGGHH
jgi:uncharacterized membrane protein YgcG